MSKIALAFAALICLTLSTNLFASDSISVLSGVYSYHGRELWSQKQLGPILNTYHPSEECFIKATRMHNIARPFLMIGLPATGIFLLYGLVSKDMVSTGIGIGLSASLTCSRTSRREYPHSIQLQRAHCKCCVLSEPGFNLWPTRGTQVETT